MPKIINYVKIKTAASQPLPEYSRQAESVPDLTCKRLSACLCVAESEPESCGSLCVTEWQGQGSSSVPSDCFYLSAYIFSLDILWRVNKDLLVERVTVRATLFKSIVYFKADHGCITWVYISLLLGKNLLSPKM